MNFARKTLRTASASGIVLRLEYGSPEIARVDFIWASAHVACATSSV
jgi:pantoate kinase